MSSDVKNNDPIEKIRFVFEKYVQERVKESKVIFYYPKSENDKNVKLPYVSITEHYLYKQEYLFPLLFYFCLKTYNSLMLSSKLSKATPDKKVDLINKFYVPPLTIRKSNTFLFCNVSIIAEHLEKTSSTSLLMHLIHEFEMLMERKPMAIFDNIVKSNEHDFKKYNCLQIADTKYINMADKIQSYIMDTSQRFLHYNLDEDLKTLHREPNINSIIEVCEGVLKESYNDVKKEMSDDSGFAKMDFSNKREQHQQQMQFTPPSPQNNNQKNNPNKKRSSGKKK